MEGFGISDVLKFQRRVQLVLTFDEHTNGSNNFTRALPCQWHHQLSAQSLQIHANFLNQHWRACEGKVNVHLAPQGHND